MKYLLSSCVALMAPGVAGAGTADVFKANRLYVVSAGSGGETITEIDYSTVVDGGSINVSTTVRTIGDGTSLAAPTACAFGPNGNLYVATRDPADVSAPFDGQILIFAPDGSPVGSPITAPNLFEPTGLAFGPQGHFFVVSTGSDAVMEFDADGTFLQNIGLGADLDNPTGIVVGHSGHIFVADSGSDEIYEFSPVQTDCAIRTISNGSLSNPHGMAIGPRGHLYVANRGANNVLEFDESGGLVQTIGAVSTLQAPEFIAIGFDSHLYVTSRNSDRVVVFDGDETPSGTPHPQIAVLGGTANVSLNAPSGLAFSPQRIGVDVKGSIFRAGSAKTKRNETFANGSGPVLSWAPGTRFVSLTFVDDTGSTNDLASVFGADQFVFHGFQVTQDILVTTRAFAGQMIVEPNLDSGSASLFLDLEGKVNAEGQFSTKEVSGRIVIEARNAIYQGKITFVKEIK
jgi:NHL repeat